MDYFCRELPLDDFMAITAIPVANLHAERADSPVNRFTRTIPADEFFPTYEGAVTIGITPVSEYDTLVPIIRHSGKAKDEEADTVAGRAHTVTVTCEVDERDPDVWEALLALERIERHLVLTFHDKTRAFVAASEDSYVCTVGRDGAKTSVQFRIHDLMGIQPVV